MEIFKDQRIIDLIKFIQDSIKGTHFEGHVFIVGGAIRDSVLNLPVKDVDLVVDIKNGGLILANYLTARTQCYVVGSNPVMFENYGTAKFQLYKNEEFKDIIIECVESRKSKNEFGTIDEDAKRRDLTINSLMYNISTSQVYDFNKNSVDDMLSQTLRTPNAYNTIKEDPIKILRIIRFSTQFGWGIEKDTWLSMIENAKLIKTVAQEKISDEISKILLCKNPSVGIRKMYNCGILHRVMPDIYDTTYAYESKNPMVTTFDHTMNVLDSVQPYLENRLAALFHDVGRIITDRRRDVNPDKFSADVAVADLKAMKFPNYIIKSVDTAIKYHRFFKIYADGVIPPDKKIRKFINLSGDDLGASIDLMNANNMHCTYGKKKKQVLDILNRIEEMEDADNAANVKLPINGNDIQQYFSIKPSPVVGIALEKVKDAYFENPNMTKDEALEIVEKLLKTIY